MTVTVKAPSLATASCRAVFAATLGVLLPLSVHAQGNLVRLNEPLTGVDISGQAAGSAVPLSLSDDGTVAVFVTGQSNLVADDTNTGTTLGHFGRDVFIRDIPAGTTRRIMGVNGAEPNGDASSVEITGDGRYVFFVSVATNMVASDPNGATDSTFRHDLVTGETTLVDVGGVAGHLTFRLARSGRYFGRLASGVRLVDVQLATATTILADASPLDFRLNADASVVAFTSIAIPGVYSGLHAQLFVRDRITNTYELISRRPDGLPGNGSIGGLYGRQTFAISDDGRYVAFVSSASDLVPNDTNAVSDVFIHDRVTRETTRVSVTAAGAQRTLASFAPAISGDGHRL
jgi:hypothetical protein